MVTEIAFDSKKPLSLRQIRASNASGIINYFYVVVDRDKGCAIAIDPAWDIHSLTRALEQTGATLEGVLLTHSHFDHVDLAPKLAIEHGCRVWMSAVETSFYSFRSYGLEPLDGEGIYHLGTVPVEMLTTPGHTKGSVCYRIGDCVFTGDTLFAEGCGICWGSGASPTDMFHSLRKLKERLSPQNRVYPGHSYGRPPGQTFQLLLKNNIYLQFDRLDPFVEFRMRSVQTGLFQFR